MAHLYRSLRSLLCISALAVTLLACNTAFREAMHRGDDFAKRGQWDEAALAYEEARGHDPDDDEARLKLVFARRQQAAVRVARGRVLMKSGDARGALVPFAEAVRLDPHSLDARRGLDAAKREVLAQAHRALDAGQFKESYSLVRAYLIVDPSNADARQVEAVAKERIAEAAFARGSAAEKAGTLAVAAVDYGEALQFKPNHVEASARLGEVRRQLREEVTYYVALKNFDGDPSADALGSDVNAAILANGIDPALPLRIVDTMPKPKAYKLQGMRLGGMFRDYRYKKTSSRAAQSCDYICGTELVDNPHYASAEASMRAAQSMLGTAEGRLSSAKAAIGPAETARDTAKKNRDARRAEATVADQELATCRAQANGQAGACSAEEQRKTSADQAEDAADDEARRTEDAFQRAKSELSDAESDLSFKRSDAASKKATFESTPVKVEIDKHCLHTYSIDTFIVAGEVNGLLSGEGLYDTEAVLNRSVTGRVSRSDQTFPAQAGVCAEVAKGDPLTLPSEAEVRKLVLSSAITAAQKELLTAFGRYRDAYLVRGRALAADGRANDSIDALVRYSFTLAGEAQGEAKDAPTNEAISKIASQRGVEEGAVRIALFGAAAR